MDVSKSFYIDLEQELYLIRLDFEMCQEQEDKDVLVWATFFLHWSQKASRYCGQWSKENLKLTQKMVNDFDVAKFNGRGYPALWSVMNTAFLHLR